MRNDQLQGYLPGMLRQAQDFAERHGHRDRFHDIYAECRRKYDVYDSMRLTLKNLGLWNDFEGKMAAQAVVA